MLRGTKASNILLIGHEHRTSLLRQQPAQPLRRKRNQTALLIPMRVKEEPDYGENAQSLQDVTLVDLTKDTTSPSSSLLPIDDKSLFRSPSHTNTQIDTEATSSAQSIIDLTDDIVDLTADSPGLQERIDAEDREVEKSDKDFLFDATKECNDVLDDDYLAMWLADSETNGSPSQPMQDSFSTQGPRSVVKRGRKSAADLNDDASTPPPKKVKMSSGLPRVNPLFTSARNRVTEKGRNGNCRAFDVSKRVGENDL